MKALIIVNPNSTTQNSEIFRHIIPKLLAVPGLQLKARFTHHPGHARDICSGLTREDADVVIGVGGDGTVNELVNGLLGPVGSQRPPEQLPAVAIIPTGSANVFVRALGFPPESIQAAEVLAELLAHDRAVACEKLNLGTWNDQWFVVNAGFGLDADVIEKMERVRRSGFAATPLRYLRAAFHVWNTTRRYPPSIKLKASTLDGAIYSERLPFVMASNTHPWTYLGPLPVVTNPRTSFALGIGLFGARSLDGVVGVFAVMRMLGIALPGAIKRWINSRIFVTDNVDSVDIHCDAPQSFQVDGEFAGEYDHVHLGVVPSALDIYSPPKKIPASPESAVRLVLRFFDIRV
ncbi:diacylglycerol kinase family protein [Corynebacterium sp. ES2775-CONJ]|uniref:diacylglycerol/lipid kinase family protein n=1 Tax=Corynebacterium sp. ES2775-CONJ TaxID=2974029 RepID=UPI00216885E8|nr:diacylglycerol kinase family protein [Corynebacterium sp. ES2775-CONJ]MCS4490305.1 diacylglycerol kinase family lipid kinase [Corynebacterium sp. ES2775-CONJ]